MSARCRTVRQRTLGQPAKPSAGPQLLQWYVSYAIAAVAEARLSRVPVSSSELPTIREGTLGSRQPYSYMGTCWNDSLGGGAESKTVTSFGLARGRNGSCRCYGATISLRCGKLLGHNVGGCCDIARAMICGATRAAGARRKDTARAFTAWRANRSSRDSSWLRIARSPACPAPR